MKNFQNEFEVNSNIDRVWEFYTDLRHLEIISPRNIRLNLIEYTDRILKKGTVACFDGRIIINARWCSKITVFEKYEYVDEMIQNGSKKPLFVCGLTGIYLNQWVEIKQRSLTKSSSSCLLDS
ncbi:MAG TPA: hypothetical protein VJ599_06795 [Nitrososphaeraceae archaeon]|nr:hypothetical protein [Nitrososphaeraceae archaeon]